jgi:hypothetical protein
VASSKVAEIEANVVSVTELVDTVKFALVFPAAIVTLEGTAAARSLLESVIVAPPAGAALIRFTVPVVAVPAVTREELSRTE